MDRAERTVPQAIDLQPELPADVREWTPERWADYYRTVNTRASLFMLMVASRGLDDQTTQQAWTNLARAIQGAR